jgi:hypothetical protein
MLSTWSTHAHHLHHVCHVRHAAGATKPSKAAQSAHVRHHACDTGNKSTVSGSQQVNETHAASLQSHGSLHLAPASLPSSFPAYHLLLPAFAVAFAAAYLEAWLSVSIEISNVRYESFGTCLHSLYLRGSWHAIRTTPTSAGCGLHFLHRL